MLDTNMASYVIKGHPPAVRKRLETVPLDSMVISTVTQAELLYGLARKGHPAGLATVIREFLLRVEVLRRPPRSTVTCELPVHRPALFWARCVYRAPNECEKLFGMTRLPNSYRIGFTRLPTTTKRPESGDRRAYRFRLRLRSLISGA
ncbi:PIN domain-containing protein [Dyella flagellata]|uniref:PIN domain-containing protein n=1 Tax=Dyella flagellata TaxID=1867833 RepID=UPI0038515718